MSDVPCPWSGPGCYVLVSVLSGSRHANPLPEPPPGRKIERIWTLINGEKLARLGPMHQVSAFLEDHIHDWRLDNAGKLHFYSRLAEMNQTVQIVVDYETEDESRRRLTQMAAAAQPCVG